MSDPACSGCQGITHTHTCKITMSELSELFGESMPIEAVTILQKDGTTVDEARLALNELAKGLRDPAPPAGDPVAWRMRLITDGYEPGDWSYYNSKPSNHRRYECKPLFERPVDTEAWKPSRLDIAMAIDPKAFDDDYQTRHKHCSPFKIEVVQQKALLQADVVLALRPAAPAPRSAASTVEPVALMHTALEQAVSRMEMAVEWWNRGGHSLPQMSAAIELGQAALSAYGEYTPITVSGSTAAPTTSPEPFDLTAFQKEAETWEDVETERELTADEDRLLMQAVVNSSQHAYDLSPEPDAVIKANKDLARRISTSAQWWSAPGPNNGEYCQIMVLDRKQYETLIAALSRPAHGGWQDISTAPKDGTRVILYCQEDDTMWWAYWSEPTSEFKCWFGCDENGLTRSSSHYTLTHWRPMPTRPLARNQGEGGGPRS